MFWKKCVEGDGGTYERVPALDRSVEDAPPFLFQAWTSAKAREREKVQTNASKQTMNDYTCHVYKNA